MPKPERREKRTKREPTAAGGLAAMLPGLVVLALLALVLRLALIPVATKHGYAADHDDFVRWGIQATDRGLLTLYTEPPPRHSLRRWDGQRWVAAKRPQDRICNYPPLSAYLLYGSGIVFRGVSAERLINTGTSRLVFSIWSIVGDLVLAAGCAAIVALYCRRAAVWVTYGLVLFLPPLWWDSAVWGQMDSVVLAPLVWSLYFMLRARWGWAGVLWGVALGLKTLAVLFVPVWAVALLLYWKRGRRVLLGLALAAGVLLIASLPFTLTSGAAWFERSYWQNLTTAYADRTTMAAFNLWYLDLLVTDSYDANVQVLGLTRNAWGRVFLLAGLAGGGWVVWSRRRGSPHTLLLWTVVSLLAFVMLPTRVHERYLIVVLPFLTVTAMLTWRLWPGLLILTAVATAQVTWPLWLSTAAGRSGEIRAWIVRAYSQFDGQPPAPDSIAGQRMSSEIERKLSLYRRERAETVGWEWAFTLLALFGTALTVLALLALPPPHDPGPSEAVPATARNAW